MRRTPGALLGIGLLAALHCSGPQAQPIEGGIGATLKTAFDRGTGTFDHGIWDAILREHAEQGGRKFDYVGLKKEEARLDAYLDGLARVELASLARDEVEALFINAYNAYTVKTVLGRVSPDGEFEIRSIRDVPDVFTREDHVVGGFRLSLDNMEHNILRPYFKDPRLHFAVNCASTSCPPVPPLAFRGDRVDRQLEETTEKVLRDPDYVRVEGDHLLVSRIMDWYRSDFVSPGFEGSEESLPAFIRKYTRDEVRDWIDAQDGTPRVSFMDYDWSLNRAN